MGFPQLGGGFGEVVEVVGQGATGRMGHAAAGKQLAAASLAAPMAQGRIGAQERHLQQLRQPLFQLGHHITGQEAAARPQQLLDARQQGRTLQQFFGERAVGGVVGIKQVQAPAGVGGGHPGQQLEHRIHHQFGQQLAGHIDGPHPRIAQPNQGKQLALLVVVGAGHQGHLGRIHGERGHHQQIKVDAVAVVLPAPLRPELLLEFAKAEGHQIAGPAAERAPLQVASEWPRLVREQA